MMGVARPSVLSTGVPATRTPGPPGSAARTPVPVGARPQAGAPARSPQQELVARLSKEVIERIVWEVVPELAEAIIRQELDRLIAAREREPR